MGRRPRGCHGCITVPACLRLGKVLIWAGPRGCHGRITRLADSNKPAFNLTILSSSAVWPPRSRPGDWMASVDNDAILEGLLFPGSRHFLLLSEAVLVEFVAQRWRARLTFPPLTSRFRRLLHTLVKRFSCLDSSSPEWGHDKCVTVTRTADGLPSGLVLLAQICSGIAKPNVKLVLSAAQVCLSLSLSLSFSSLFALN